MISGEVLSLAGRAGSEEIFVRRLLISCGFRMVGWMSLCFQNALNWFHSLRRKFSGLLRNQSWIMISPSRCGAMFT